MMASFYYYDQNPSSFCFLVQIRAFVTLSSLGLPNLNSGRCSKMTPSCKWPIQNVIPQLKEDYAAFP